MGNAQATLKSFVRLKPLSSHKTLAWYAGFVTNHKCFKAEIAPDSAG
jgi:hypothetical protein